MQIPGKYNFKNDGYYKVEKGYKDYFIINSDDLPRAYFSMMNPDTVFSCPEGIVLGRQITGIVPFYNRAMGWNEDYELGPYDYEEINDYQLKEKYTDLMEDAIQIARTGDERLIELPLSESRALLGKTEERNLLE